MIGILNNHSKMSVMVSTTTITVDVDDRGRFTIPEPARRALSLSGKANLELDIRVLVPEDAEGNSKTIESETDNRGRVTIKPASVRRELGIKDRESTVEVTLSKKFDSGGSE